jgi:hypothetical protein
MTPEELLKPRYKVIAPYPDMPFSVGQVLLLQKHKEGWEYTWAEHDGFHSMTDLEMSEFPHLFKEMEWWEEREEKDMPEYVKINADECSFIRGTVLKVDGVGRYPDRIKPLGNEGDLYVTLTIPEDTETHDAGEQVTMNVKNVLPATLSEYEQLNKAK